MDPFVEMQEWEDFHPNFISEIQTQLAPKVEPKYFVRVEKRVYVEQYEDGDEPPRDTQQRIPDVAVLATGTEASMESAGVGTATLAAPEECIVPSAVERREYYLVIRMTETHEIVTLLELLSPTNKRAGADGRDIFLKKRRDVLAGSTHFVELDLVRSGERLPLSTKSPLGRDYYALVSRADRRPRAELYRWSLRESMPTVPIPLGSSDPDVPLDLQAAFAHVYERTRYDLSLDSTAPLAPPPSKEEHSWVNELVAHVRRTKS